MKVSVALLTKNGGELLKECLRAVCSQRTPWPFEILAIDSGSRDGSAEFLRAQPGVKFTAIPAIEFQHGRTRNLAMRQAQGDLVVFLTQDAVPAGDAWLAQLVAFMDSHPGVAGAFGRQQARAGADPLEAWEIARHFETFASGPPVLRAYPADAAGIDGMERARMHFFSNVNSCIRRSAWERIAFPGIEFGEDQAWAFEVQKAGLATGYAIQSVVWHSHAYGTFELFRRRYDEARFMRRHFGYSLVSTWQEAIRIARAHTETYRLHLAEISAKPGAGNWRHAAARAWASSLGRFAGTHLAGNDGFVHRCLSLHEQYRRA